MDPELLRLLLALLRDQNTTGSAETGGTWPYDDYGLQNTIGGLGAVDPAFAPVPNTIGAHDFGFVGDPFYMSEGTNGQAAIGGEPPMHVAPGFAPAPGQRTFADAAFTPMLANLDAAQMQRGRPQVQGLFGNAAAPAQPPVITRSNPPTAAGPVAAPTAEPLGIRGKGAGPQPAPTAQPVARFNDALPKAKQRQTKTIPKRQNAQQAVQQITRQAAATQPQRQFSAPAPTFTNAPASRSAAQNSLANTLNLLRSLVRR